MQATPTTTTGTGTADEAEAHHQREEEAHERLLRRLEECLREPLEWVERADGGSTTTTTARSPPLVRPLVLTGQRWPAHHLWSVAYVQRRVDPTGRALVEVNRSRSERFPDFSFDAADEAEANPRVRLPFSSFVDHLLAPSPPAVAAAAAGGGGGGEWLYLSGDAAHLRHCGRDGGLFAPLLADIRVPPMIDPRHLATIGFWMGRKGTVAHLHFDRNGCHNINAQVRGRKLFVLFPPSEFAKLYPPPSSSLSPHAHHRGEDHGEPRRRSLGLLRNMSQIDLRTIHEPQQRERFPAFAGVRGVKVVLGEGEMLVIPACWYHFVMGLDELNINVNFWWKPDLLADSPLGLPDGFPNCEEEQQQQDAEPRPAKPATPRPSRRG